MEVGTAPAPNNGVVGEVEMVGTATVEPSLTTDGSRPASVDTLANGADPVAPKR
jgi:hypothetical protein